MATFMPQEESTHGKGGQGCQQDVADALAAHVTGHLFLDFFQSVKFALVGILQYFHNLVCFMRE